MNFHQLEYIIAIDTYRHFAKAAEKTFVTQPTLSMMVQKLEEELGIRIFDRSKQPVVPTTEGIEVIVRARQIMADVSRLKEFSRQLKHEISGEMKLAVIPTLAPYLLPLFLKSFAEKYPLLKISIRELVTDEIINSLKNGDTDIGLLATPLKDPRLEEYPVFYEEFFAYTATSEKASKKKYLLPKDIDLSKLWLLEEGHCLRNQVLDLCELKKKDFKSDRLHYETGSIETLKNLVDHHQGITILPHLATLDLSKKQKEKIREFAHPKPVREISLVVNKNFHRVTLLEALKTEIERQLPDGIGKAAKKRVLEI
jgi:LysR family transcriptional regulator, hydrogen peroxide-inducible genes activator